jgi:hypothetical protein
MMKTALFVSLLLHILVFWLAPVSRGKADRKPAGCPLLSYAGGMKDAIPPQFEKQPEERIPYQHHSPAAETEAYFIEPPKIPYEEGWSLAKPALPVKELIEAHQRTLPCEDTDVLSDSLSSHNIPVIPFEEKIIP